MSTVKEPAPGVSRATSTDLAKVKSKAELINGRVVHLMPTSYLPNRVAFESHGAWTTTPKRPDKDFLHRQSRIRPGTYFRPRIILAGCCLLHGAAPRESHAVCFGCTHVFCRSAERERLRRRR